MMVGSSNFAYDESESRQITAISNRVVTLDMPLSYLHFGAPSAETVQGLTVENRAEVALLSRNVKIIGEGEGMEFES